MDVSDIAVRLGSAAAIGCALGLNRYVHHKRVGVRTLGLVSLATAGVVAATCDTVSPEAASRVIQGVITGIGFLGAGVIMHDSSDHKVHGLTTAAAVWLAAIVGAVCGLGAWKFAIVLAAISLALLLCGGHAERWVSRHLHTGHDGATGTPLDETAGPRAQTGGDRK